MGAASQFPISKSAPRCVERSPDLRFFASSRYLVLQLALFHASRNLLFLSLFLVWLSLLLRGGPL